MKREKGAEPARANDRLADKIRLLWYIVSGQRQRAARFREEKRRWRAQKKLVARSGYFDPDWYLRHHPKAAKSKLSPLRHFLDIGWRKGANPGPDFDSQWYIRKYPDVKMAGVNPLVHYVVNGRLEGRKPSPYETKAGSFPSAASAEIACLKWPSRADEVALFITHSPDGRMKDHVRHYLRALHEEKIAVILIVAADVPFTEDIGDIADDLEGIFIRENRGYDFAAWAHILSICPEIYDSNILFFLNDSIIGPSKQSLFAELIARIRTSDADLVGLTENHERGWHIQSYFIALKKRVLSSVSLHRFIGDIAILNSKEDVINSYEVRLARVVRRAGFKTEALFDSGGADNSTIFRWKEILAQGFPFVKVMTLRDKFPGVDTSDWRSVLASSGFDVDVVGRVVEGSKKALAAPTAQIPLLSKKTTRSLAPMAVASLARPNTALPKIEFYGPWNYQNGLGVASRGYVSALQHVRALVNLHPIERSFHTHKRCFPPVPIIDFSAPADVTIIHLNPDGWPGLLTDEQREHIAAAQRRVGLWVWEMLHVPPFWYPGFDEVDEIWAPSEYCAAIFRQAAKVPVHVLPHIVPLPVVTRDESWGTAFLESYGLPEDARIVLFSFDGSSYLARKNPFALVRAFAAAGLAERGWHLVLKAKNVHDIPAAGRSLLDLVERTGNVTVIDKEFDRSAMVALLARADIFASPHCSEGFGLTIAEAMAMGKIVVATDYSGSRDFLDATCGFPVDYRLETLTEGHGHYQKGNSWATVDEGALAVALDKAAREAEAGGSTIGEAARQRIAERLSPTAVARQLEQHVARLMKD